MPSYYNGSVRKSQSAFGGAVYRSDAARLPVRSTLAAAIAAVLVGLPPSASAQSIQELKAQTVTGGDIPGSFKLPGGDTSVRLGGYVKLDGIYSSRGVGGLGDQLFLPATIPVGAAAGAAENHFQFHARETRFNIFTQTPTAMGPLTTLIEADFFGTSGTETSTNSNGLRLRHAYGTLGSFGAGQFWSNFMDVDAIPDTLDFGGPAGQIFVRQAQVRWTEKFSGGQWVLSLENPEAVIGSTTAATVAKPDSDRVPDIIGNVQSNVGPAKLSVAAIARNVRINTAAASDNRWGGSLAFSGIVPVVGRDDFRFQAYGGTAIGRYQNGFFVDGVIDSTTGQLLSLPKVFGGHVAYRHFWTSSLRSSLELSAARADLPDRAFGGLNKSDNSAHVNAIWSPVKNADIGLEFLHGRRETEDGSSGSLNRIQFSSKYAF